VLHAVKDLRIEEVAAPPLGTRACRRCASRPAASAVDLHYYFDGGFGTVRLREPMILGHEIAGTVGPRRRGGRQRQARASALP
jgi:L-idonate 5-dehydrogenase